MAKWYKLLSSNLKVDWFKIFVIAMCVCGFAIIGFVYGFYHSHFPFITDDNESWGQFGDFVGGTLNSIFSFFTFLAILYTLHLQREELRLNRDELKLNREELIKSNTEAGKQTQIATNQLESSLRQKNEEYLLDYMKVYNELESEIRNPSFTNKIGVALLESFFAGITAIELNEEGNLKRKDGLTLSNKNVFKYLNCLEYLIHWDLLQFINEAPLIKRESEHRSFSSSYSNFIRSFCDEQTFTQINKSGVLLKLNIASKFPNIARFL